MSNPSPGSSGCPVPSLWEREFCCMGQGFTRPWDIFLAAGVAWQWRGQQLYLDAGDAYLHHV